MKKSRLLLMSSMLMLASCFCGCSSDNDSDSGIQVRNFANTGCKPMVTRADGQSEMTAEYIEYRGMEDGYLSIKHVNAMFSCHSRPKIEATVSGSEVTILEYKHHETEDYISAMCDCPYDLYCEVGPLAAGKNTIIICQDEGKHELCRFTIDNSKELYDKFTIREWPNDLFEP